MRRVILCCALLGALILVAVACKSVADGSATSATTAKGKPHQTDTTTSAPAIQSAPKEGSYETIPQDRAKSEMDIMAAEGKPFILLDVRRQDEFDAGHIEGALLLPNEKIGTKRPDVLPDLAVPIYVYCRSGNRSLQAAKKLAAMGYTVYDFGGIMDWPYGTITGGEQ
ncbi:MAG: rhodanese-like domain-containing protein [Clostridia bacterium]|nr:rhodanese-like domain-containing protein [Clostridia bacterium]